MGKAVVVFDFDRTIIDGDSDQWVVTQMNLSHLFNQLLSSLPWNSLMNRMMEELHLQGQTTEDIAMCLRELPLDPHIISAINSAHSSGCELRIVSDANRFFIETILKHHGLLGCFTEIVTNPTFVDEQGMLCIAPFHDFRLSPHGCSLCPSNMCKGMIVERMQASMEKNKTTKLIYIGDGKGDYCPTLKLGEDDHVMPRMHFPLWDRICTNPTLIRAKVHGWTNGDELQKILLGLVNSTTMEGNGVDC